MTGANLPPSLRPFRGLYLDPMQAGDASVFTTPPHDAITPDQEQALHERSPYNVVRLVLGLPEPGDSRDANRYTRARKLLLDWQRAGVLRRENDPMFYLYEQEFAAAGRSHHRISLLALARLPDADPPASAPSSPARDPDRERLIASCHAQLSPVVEVLEDARGDMAELLERMHYDADDHRAEFRDDAEVLHRFKAIRGATYASAVATVAAGAARRIVDGHGCHDAAWRYRAVLRRDHPDFEAEGAENFVMTALLSSRDPSLPDPQLPFAPRLRSGLVIARIDADSLG